MGLTQDELKNATIIPAGCVFVIGLAVITCCCLRCKNQREELERRRAHKKSSSDTHTLKMDEIHQNNNHPTNSYTNGGTNFRTFSDIAFEQEDKPTTNNAYSNITQNSLSDTQTQRSDIQTPCSNNPSYEEEDGDVGPDTIYDGGSDEHGIVKQGSLDCVKRGERDSDAGSCSSASINNSNKSTSQIPVSM